MKQSISTHETLACWLCDYGLLLVAIIVLLIVAVFRVMPALPAGESVGDGLLLSQPTRAVVAHTPGLTPTPVENVIAELTPTDVLTTVPTLTTLTPQKPEFIMAVLPINWRSDKELFRKNAETQTNLFIEASSMQQFFEVKVQIIDNGLDNLQLSDSSLLEQVVDFGLQQVAANRYVAITDGDLRPRGMKDVTGWTCGLDCPAIIVEALDVSTTAHEMAHTFGLCDEYNYAYWTQQNLNQGGCPNRYPDRCPRTGLKVAECEGTPTDDGKNSIMGPSGLPGNYGFNRESSLFLQKKFKELVEQQGRS